MGKRRLAMLVVALSCVLVPAAMVGSAAAGPFTIGPLNLISGPSPFTNCNIGPGGTNYLNAEVEPWVAVNPSNPTNMIGVYQQDRWSDGGARGLMASVTHNGGASWSRSFAPFTFCSGGNVGNGATSSVPQTRGSRSHRTATRTRLRSISTAATSTTRSR